MTTATTTRTQSTGVIFLETLRRYWRSTLYWGLGVIVWALYPFALMPDDDGLQDYVEVIESFDPALARAVGIGDIAAFATPEGFVGYAFFAYILLILAVYAVLNGLSVSINEEENGIMDSFLALPIARWQVIVEKFLALSVLIVGIGLMTFVGFLLGMQISPTEIDISTGSLLAGAMSIIPGVILMLAVTIFVGTLARRRTTAAGLAAGFIIVSYLLDVIGGIAEGGAGETLGQLSFFRYMDGTEVLNSGLPIGPSALVLLIAAVLVGIAAVLFERRDIAV